ncbi:MAG: ATP-binding protein [Patescibacteria group bacterium]
MRETKVNLKHLLEDIKDSYTITIEEIILLELIANALDSKASRISFYVDCLNNTLTAADNGKGMKRGELTNYHNIAATTKIKGRGIGFAGIGAKLSLLIAEKVQTETRGSYGSRCAAEWHLKNETSAPWKFIPFSGKNLPEKGTAVSIFFKNSNSPLLSEKFIAETTYNHFYPLFHQEPFSSILKHVYKKGVEFFINGKKISFEYNLPAASKTFQIRLNRRLAGTGFLAKYDGAATAPFQGLGVSTYGKVIKSGWEWLGIWPKEHGQIYGMAEIPELSEILTTNKMDFLKDAASLKKYYLHRKSIQEAVIPILKEFGENLELESSQKQYKLLSKEIEKTLRSVLKNFPELTPLLGLKTSRQKESVFSESTEAQLVSIVKDNLPPENKTMDNNNGGQEGVKKEKEKQEVKKNISPEKKGNKLPSLIIGFENRSVKDPVARMLENKIWINNFHPAYIKAKQENLEEYHIILSVALTLSSFLEDKHLPQKFINDFLSVWGAGGKTLKKTAALFKI